MKTLRIPFTILCALTICALSAHAGLKVTAVDGTVTKYSADGTQSPVAAGDVLSEGDSLSATALSSAMLVDEHGCGFTINENSSVNVITKEGNAHTLLELNYGEIDFQVKNSNFIIETPLGSAAISNSQGLIRLFYSAERGEFIFMVKNSGEGLVDVKSRYIGEFEYNKNLVADLGYESRITEDKSDSLPTGHTVILRLYRADEKFEDLFNLLQNYIPTDGNKGLPRGLSPTPRPERTPIDPSVIIVSPEASAPINS